MSFSAVITLKAIDGENRFEQFLWQCRASNWFVDRLDIKAMLDVYQEAEEDINFDE